jgi:hypothetical protein
MIDLGRPSTKNNWRTIAENHPAWMSKSMAAKVGIDVSKLSPVATYNGTLLYEVTAERPEFQRKKTVDDFCTAAILAGWSIDYDPSFVSLDRRIGISRGTRQVACHYKNDSQLLSKMRRRLTAAEWSEIKAQF